MFLPPLIEKRLLQGAVVVCACVPVLAGAGEVMTGNASIDNVAGYARNAYFINFHSHYSYLSGLLLGIGLGFWSCVPRIETRTQRFELLSLIVFIGGLARLSAALHDGMPHHVMKFALVMELLVTPALCLWQRRVARIVANHA